MGYSIPTPGGGDETEGSPGGEVSDHGALSGLGDDDHSQYLNNDRGDARYAQIADTVTSSTVDNIVVLTQSAYDALGTPDPTTLYFISG